MTVFGGDPTATTIVPRALQVTFYSWVQHPGGDQSRCTTPRYSGYVHTYPARLRLPLPPPPRRELGEFCVLEVGKVFNLLNTPTEQRFSTGKLLNVAQAVITIRGVHRQDNPKAKAAITDIEFFQKH
jgi:hypothetical protein